MSDRPRSVGWRILRLVSLLLPLIFMGCTAGNPDSRTGWILYSGLAAVDGYAPSDWLESYPIPPTEEFEDEEACVIRIPNSDVSRLLRLIGRREIQDGKYEKMKSGVGFRLSLQDGTYFDFGGWYEVQDSLGVKGKLTREGYHAAKVIMYKNVSGRLCGPQEGFVPPKIW